MSGTTVDDGSEDVNDFLLRIKELGNQRDKEDEERTRKLEEEIIQGRKERRARRAERARSLSPTKDTSNADTSGLIRSNNNMQMQEDFSKTPSFQPPSTSSSGLDNPPRKANCAPPNTNAQELGAAPRETSQAPSKPQKLSITSSSAAMAPSRAGSLSWQQRPSSRGSPGPRSRPLSVLASENNAAKPARESADPAPASDSSMSRSQIAQSLGVKDPTWFKQTKDRGLRSAAYRRNQDDASGTSSMTGTMRLPGMSRESTVEHETRKSPPPDSVLSSSPSVGDSIRRISQQSQSHSSSVSVSSNSAIRSPLPTMANQRFEPPISDTISSSDGETSSVGRTLAMSPSQGRISPERMDRPASPTKGLGGFVQSAMMKRSDSVNKRWSAQPGPGLSRGNSVASNTSGYGTSRYPRGGITPLTESRPNSISRENSPAIISRPDSSHSNATVTQCLKENEGPGISTSLASNKSESTFGEKFAIPARESKSPPALAAETIMSPPANPSKRWSPSKASWLENAINKPDSPRAKMPVSQQPAWMADIARAKQQRGSVDLSKATNFKEVTIDGLVRSPPPGAGFKPPSKSGLPSGFSVGIAVKHRTGSFDDLGQKNGTPEVAEEKVGSGASSPLHARSPKPSSNEINSSEIKEAAFGKDEQQTSPSAKKGSSGAGTRTISPTAMKSKPERPPKKDFRSTLKSRPVDGDANSKDEPEFKNVFGKLKRTQTQNYKAPDELKDNIMRGKAGLAQTGGPKKTERKDEFKESILQKKQGMVAPSASMRITSASSKTPDQTIPEAIAKKKGLTRSESLLSDSSTQGEKETTKPEALAKLQHLRDKPKPVPPETQSGPSAASQQEPTAKSPSGGTFASSLAGILQRGPSLMADKPRRAPPSESIAENASMSTGSPEPASAGPQLTHVTKARAKGPKRRLPTASKNDVAVETELSAPASQSKQFFTENKPATVSNAQSSPTTSSTPKAWPLSNTTNDNRKIAQPNLPGKLSTSIALTGDIGPASPVSQSPIKKPEARISPIIKQKPVISPKLDKRPNASISIPEPLPDTPSELSKVQEPHPSAFPSASEQQKREIEPQESARPLSSVRGAAALWGQSPKPTRSSQHKSPVKLPTRRDEEAALEETGLNPREPVGLGIKTPVKQPEPSLDCKPALPAAQSPKSPPLPGKKSSSIVGLAASTNLQQPNTAQSSRSTLSQSTEASELFADIFDEVPNLRNNANVDTQAVINTHASNNSSQKIKTLRKQIFEVTSNGKSVPVPSQQEHILFEDSLYLCTHVFGSPSGQRTTEVYLWCGDGVSSSSVEDAQIFAKKVVKDINGKFIFLQQGKETSNFFQALGGIVVIRRGRATSSSGSAATYMLCGRQHVGQIAFDEVDFTSRSLCKGFPYIVSTQSGKLYLWKGSGSGADELGCARLIGMDIGLTGEIEEVDEGKEPAAFWQSFQGGRRDVSGASSEQHWHLKPSCEQYATRLFAVDVELPRPKSSSGFMSWGRRGSAPSNDTNTASTPQIKEIMPFAQSDLVDDGIFVLDAFFEIYIIFTIRYLTPAPQHKSTKSAAFRAALFFAQEYGILAASAEDRPFVPVGSVVICSRNGSGSGNEVENIPEGMQRVFRKWDGKKIAECRVLPLTAALEATG